jgi:hypothetical protein
VLAGGGLATCGRWPPGDLALRPAMLSMCWLVAAGHIKLQIKTTAYLENERTRSAVAELLPAHRMVPGSMPCGSCFLSMQLKAYDLLKKFK